MTRDDTISFWSFATDPERYPTNRGLGWGIPEKGYQHFVDAKIRPLIEKGYTRFFLRAPAGLTIIQDGDGNPTFTWPMAFDQFVIAQREDRIDALAHEKFVAAWHPITNAGCEVIAYIGSLTHSPGMKGLDPDEWYWRAWASLNTPLEAGCSIGFDRGSKFKAGSKEHLLLQQLNEMGVRTYIEPHPKPEATHLHDQNVIVVNEHWNRAWTKYDVRSKLTGEVCRIADDDQDITDIHEDGHTAVVRRNYL